MGMTLSRVSLAQTRLWRRTLAHGPDLVRGVVALAVEVVVVRGKTAPSHWLRPRLIAFLLHFLLFRVRLPGGRRALLVRSKSRICHRVVALRLVLVGVAVARVAEQTVVGGARVPAFQ